MTEIFLAVLKMSLAASVVALVVILARLCLRKAPKIFSYVLWSAVLFRLVCPYGIPVTIDWLPAWTQGTNISSAMNAEHDSEGYSLTVTTEPEDSQPVGAADKYVGDENRDSAEASSLSPYNASGADASLSPPDFLCVAWLLGIAVMLLYIIITSPKLKKRLSTALLCGDGVYESDRIPSPFVAGLICPRIYVPSGLEQSERVTVITHEKIHIRRRDYITKAVAYLALAVHWFNPLMWLCWSLMCADMEASCDEAAMREMRDRGLSIDEVKRAYGKALLLLSQKSTGLLPAAFAGSSTRERMMNIMNYKKQKPLIIASICILCAALIVCCAINFSEASAYAVSDSDQAAPELQAETEPMEYPVTLSVGDITIQSTDTQVIFQSGVVSRLTEEDIRLLNQCKNLRSFRISEASSSDLNKIVSIENIIELSLTCCHEKDLSILTSLNKLERLELYACNGIVDFSPLAKCPCLSYLRIDDCVRFDNQSVISLKAFSQLRQLHIFASDAVTDISPLSHLTDLEVLSISNMYNVVDLSSLQSLTNLTEFYITSLRITDVSFLSSMTHLKCLQIAECRHGNISDISPIAALSKLEQLYLSCINTDDISTLAALQNLKELNLIEIHVDDLSPVYELKNLERFYLLNSEYTDEQMKELKSRLESCEIVTETLG